MKETNSENETLQKASEGTTPEPTESRSLSSEQIEEELASIGAHSYIKRANVQKINYLMVMLAFRAGYFFCIAMHKLVGITAEDQPTIAVAQEAISQMKTHLGGK